MKGRFFALYDSSDNATVATRTATAAWSLSSSVSRDYGLDLTSGTWGISSILMPNAKPLSQKDSGGTVRSLLGLSVADAMILGDGLHNIFADAGSGGSFVPNNDNSSHLGGPSNRWADLSTMASKFYGSSTGVITVQAPAAAGTNTITWPAATGIVALTAGATIPTIAQGDLLYGSAANTLSALAKDTGTSRFLKNSGTSNNPAWAQPAFTDLSGSVAAAQMPALTGDITTSAGAVATTLATVNSNVGSFGSSTSIPSFTVNAKGLVTAASGNAVIAPAGTLTGATLASNVLASSLTSVGTLTGGATGAGFTVALGTSTLTGDLPFANLTQGSALSVLGVTGGSTADVASIAGTANQVLRLNSAGTALAFGSINLASTAAVTGLLGLANGGVNADLSATGGASFFLKQNSAGAAITVVQPTASDLSNGVTGSTLVVLQNAPTLIAPVLGVASATSLTAPLLIGGSGTTGTQLTFQTTSGVGTTDAFVWKRGNNGATVAATLDNTGLGLGTVAPDTLLTLNANTAASVAVTSPTLLHLVNADATEGGITIDTYGVPPRLMFRRANGTQASKTGLVSGSVTGSLQSGGWDTAAYSLPGNFKFIALETWSASAHGIAFTIETCPAGSTTPAEAFRAHGSGGFSVGTTSDPGIGMIYTNSASFMIRTKTSYSNGAGVGVGTLTNAPASTNPTKWIPIDDNGTTRYIPAW